MKKNSLIILISTLLCSCLSIYDECLTSSLSINIDLTEVDKNKGFMPFVCIMTVNQSITLNSGKVDTIVLNVVYPKSLPVAEMGIRNVQVKCSGQNVPFRFANDSLIFNTLSCQNEYSILYEVYASSFLSNGLSAENCYVGEFYLYDISSWYFTCPDMRLDVSDITSSDSLTVISSGVNTDNTEWSRHIKPNKKIDVIALHKRFYDHFANIQGRCYCNIFLRNFYNEKLEIDTVLNDYCQYNSDYIRITEHISNDASESKVTHVEKCLHMATSIFNTPPDTLSIIECLWGNDKYSGGQAISKNIILADTVFFLAVF